VSGRSRSAQRRYLPRIRERQPDLGRHGDREHRDKLKGKQLKLRPAQDREIRRMRDSGGYKVAEIASLFTVSRPTVYQSVQRRQPCPAPRRYPARARPRYVRPDAHGRPDDTPAPYLAPVARSLPAHRYHMVGRILAEHHVSHGPGASLAVSNASIRRQARLKKSVGRPSWPVSAHAPGRSRPPIWQQRGRELAEVRSYPPHPSV